MIFKMSAIHTTSGKYTKGHSYLECHDMHYTKHELCVVVNWRAIAANPEREYLFLYRA